MNALFLSYDGLTDPLGQSQVLPYLSGLSKQGISVSIISFEKPERLAKHKFIIDEIVKENNLSWIPLLYTKRPPILSTVFDLMRLKSEAKKIIKAKKIDVVHCRTILTAIIGLSLKRELGVKMIFDMRSFLADERVDGKLWNLSNPVYKKIYKYFKSKERECLIESDQIISLTFAAKQEMLTWNLGIDESKITVIPCCVDTDLFNPQTIAEDNKLKIRAELQLGADDLIFIYVGGIGTWYCLDEMMEFFSKAKQKYQQSKFLILTAENPDIVRHSAAKYQIDLQDLIIRESLRKDVPKYLNAADIALFFILPTYSKMASSPTKQGEMMAMQLPIICNDKVGDTGSIIRKYNAGWVVEEMKPENYDKVINELTQINTFDKNEIRKGAIDFFGLKNGIANYYAVYQRLK